MRDGERCPICGKPQVAILGTQILYDDYATTTVIFYQSNSSVPPCFGHEERVSVPQVFSDAFAEGDLQL